MMFREKMIWMGGLTAVLALALPVVAKDWPMWGGGPHRNMVAEAKGLPVEINPGEKDAETEKTKLETTKHVKWVTKLGSQAYGNPTVADGRIFLGTNNASPRDARLKGDRAVIMCLDEKTGELLWQLAIPKLGAGKVSDWEYLGICSSPAVSGDTVYVVTNRCEVIALDVKGLANGNQGMKDEVAYITEGKIKEYELNDQNADILWIYDMREELGIFPHNITSSSPMVHDGVVYTATSNGVDWSHKNIPNPLAPALIGLDAKSGKLVVEEASGISQRLLHSNWSSPTLAKVDGKDQIIFGAGDGFVYGFDPKPVKDEDGFDVFKEIWRFDCNPESYKVHEGKKVPYAHRLGPSEVIATPVFIDGKVYVGTGQDPEHGEGVAIFHCIDATKEGDITDKGGIWSAKIGRQISTPAVHDGLVYVAEFAGFVHCFDAKTGKKVWTHDTMSHIWASTLVADGKVFIGDEAGLLTILQAGKEKKVLGTVEFDSPIYASPIVANNVLYITTQKNLYAIPGQGE